MSLNRKQQVLNRYTRVKSKVKNSMVESDINTYVKELIQANRLQRELVSQLIRN